ncbi:hypothetical protein BY458DRAFT_501984, partial [Sporodiniella umbellata]
MDSLNNINLSLGGYDKVVEIDEAMISKRKYNKERKKPGVWIFGMYERHSNPPKFL